MLIKLHILGIVFIVIVSCPTECKKLDDYILHYEELHYDTEEVHASHMRHKRSIDKAVHLNLNAYDRTFRLRLRNEQSAFTPDFVLEFNGTTTKPDLSFIYTGELVDVPGSRIHGGILQGKFEGSIIIPSEQETYHVENSQRFFQDQPVFHSVIYKESDMNLDPYRERRTRERREAEQHGTCGYANAKQWMREVVQSEVVPLNRAKRHEAVWQEVQHEDVQQKYSAEANRPEVHSRHRRASLASLNNQKDSCFMSLMSDPFLYDHYLTKSNQNVDLAKDAILLFFANHIEAIKNIYENTIFETYQSESGIDSITRVTFAVQKTKVMTQSDCSGELASFCQANVDVSNFLNMNSLINHDEFCLAYVFTYRDFSAGTLGLAWVGASNSASGGVCERNKRFTEGSSQVSKSLNTGIVTTINYGKEVPSKVSQLTFAHEVGHNFGSPHDSGIECAPYGTSAADASQGNYIMYASATMGDKPHNNHFSSCSKDNITRVLNAVLKSPSKYNCFAKSGPFCGNGIVEENEECDCGFESDCQDQCCVARNAPGKDSSQYCKLKPGMQCSPTQGPCCETNCKYTNATAKVCRYASECFDNASCSGNSAVCPASTHKANGTYCNNYGFVCKNGECSGSLCEKFHWTECFLSGATSTKQEQEKLCKLGCSPNASSTECIISSDTDALVKYIDYKNMVDDVLLGRGVADHSEGVKLVPGSPCNNFQGYCDVFYRCRGVDAEGPLSRLKNLIFSPETLQDIADWIVEHWWAVLLMAIGLVVAMGLFIKFCAVHTPSSNPKAKPARKLSETMTLRRRRQNQQRQQQPQPVRYPQIPQGPPPPYPGSSSAAEGSHMGPPHGHGKKGKRKGQNSMELGRI